MNLEGLLRRRNEALKASYAVLEQHEASEARVIELSETFKRLSGLHVDVAEYYEESLKSLQVGCYRASIVFAWAGFIYMLTEKMVTGYQAELKAQYSAWNTSTVQDLFNSAPEYQILDAAKKVKLIDHQKMTIYKGWLTTRNQYAHPTLHKPRRNVAIGIVDALISEVNIYT